MLTVPGSHDGFCMGTRKYSICPAVMTGLAWVQGKSHSVWSSLASSHVDIGLLEVFKNNLPLYEALYRFQINVSMDWKKKEKMSTVNLPFCSLVRITNVYISDYLP